MIYIRKPKLVELKAEIVKAQAERTNLTLDAERTELLSSLVEFYEMEQDREMKSDSEI